MTLPLWHLVALALAPLNSWAQVAILILLVVVAVLLWRRRRQEPDGQALTVLSGVLEAPVSIWREDAAGTILWSGGRALTALGFGPGDIVGMDTATWHNPGDPGDLARTALSTVAPSARGVRMVEWEQEYAGVTGGVVLQCTLTRAADGSRVGTAIDVTTDRRRETMLAADLARALEQLRSVQLKMEAMLRQNIAERRLGILQEPSIQAPTTDET